ncbi:MAG: hypothetical protein HY064_08705 [Bacteroidetes bacterium]|nr:hypothetical protein [Bacteroidota bacterium]
MKLKTRRPFFLLFIFIFFFSEFSFAGTNSPFRFIIARDGILAVHREGSFIPETDLISKKYVNRNDPGSTGHFTLLTSDPFTIAGENDSVEMRLSLPGNFIYTFENRESTDSVPYVALVSDSSTATNFLDRVKKIRKREWEIYRIAIRIKNSTETWCMYLRFQPDLLTINLPNKSNRETMKIHSISPAIPVIHLGHIDYTNYTIGPGISFNVGLAPRKPYLRLLADIVGPVSIEWMFRPISEFNDIFAIKSNAVGIFFNSGYGIFHWGIAWYTPTYSRAEAYIGINLAPAMQLFNGGKAKRYRW